MPRTLLVFAHPDDETVALGGRLGRFGRAHFVQVTDGAPRNEQDSRWHGFASWREYRAAREKEFEQLLNEAGIASARHECVEIPDQEASHQLAALTRRIAQLLVGYRPEVIFTHPFEADIPTTMRAHSRCIMRSS